MSNRTAAANTDAFGQKPISELVAMARIVKAMETQPGVIQERITRYLASRYLPEPKEAGHG